MLRLHGSSRSKSKNLLWMVMKRSPPDAVMLRLLEAAGLERTVKSSRATTAGSCWPIHLQATFLASKRWSSLRMLALLCRSWRISCPCIPRWTAVSMIVLLLFETGIQASKVEEDPVVRWQIPCQGHCDACKCSPLNHPHLAKRVAKVNTSISEQIFAWFRGYSVTFNTMNPNVQRFYVLIYARKHNAMQQIGHTEHLNPFSAHKQAMKKAGAWKKPASSKYACLPVKKTHLKRPSAAKWKFSVPYPFAFANSRVKSICERVCISRSTLLRRNPSNSSVYKIFELLVLWIVCMLQTIEKELVGDVAYGASTATFSTLSIVGICDDRAQCLQKDILLADW